MNRRSLSARPRADAGFHRFPAILASPAEALLSSGRGDELHALAGVTLGPGRRHPGPRMRPCSMHQQHRQDALADDIACHAAEQRLPPRPMAIAAHHQHVRARFLCRVEQQEAGALA